MADKKCTKCGELVPLSGFNLCRGKPRAYCKKCHSASVVAWQRENKEKYSAKAKRWHIKFRERVPPKKGGVPRMYTPEQRVIKMREWRTKWDKQNPHAVLAKTRAYQAQKIKALPRWADLGAIKEIYRHAKAQGMHVDHIVPLQSPLVCGLHCEANLQLLSPFENWSKHNKKWPDMP